MNPRSDAPPPNLRLVPSDFGTAPRGVADSPEDRGTSFKPSLLAIVPSWLFSLVLHAGLLILLAASLPGLRGGIVGDPDGDLRSVGIWVGQSGDGSDPERGSGGAKTPRGQTAIVPTPPPAPIAVPPAPATPLNTLPLNPTPIAPLPTQPIEQSPAATSPGATARILGPSDSPEQRGLFHNSTQPPTPGGKTGHGDTAGSGRGRLGSRGTTPFFGVIDVGSRFVYVIDCSGSMFSHSALDATKNELLKSLSTLNRFQQFQIVFYNTDQRWLKAPGKVDFRYFAADEANLRRATDFIAEIQADGGTQHLTAIQLALRLAPDVIFFLTDGGKPGLSAFDLEELKHLNQRHTRIHCVQFSADDDEDAAAAQDFLKKLAAQNDGQYVRRDVTRFDAPATSRPGKKPSREEP